MKKAIVLILLFGVFAASSFAQGGGYKLQTGTIHFNASDGVEVTGNLYVGASPNAPFILLFHMANSSRAEYSTVAPILNTIGFNCLAIDLRSGYEWEGTTNMTAEDAKKKGKSSTYVDSFLDAESALLFVQNTFKPPRILAMGSSFSADISLLLAAKYPRAVAGVLGFSPGGYFSFEGKQLTEFTKLIGCPVFVTASVSEARKSRPYFDSIPGSAKVFFLPKKGSGAHGVPTLYKYTSGQDEYWAAVKDFLATFLK